MSRKILKYELKRIVFSKLFLLTFFLAVLFSVFDLYTEIIQGVSGTAPFSQWSYCKFLCNINTITLLLLMLSCTDLFSKNEHRVKEITSCSPISQKKYLLIKSLALFISYFIITFCCILISMLFYITTFHIVNFVSFLLPMLIILVPAFMFVFGSSMFLGSKSQGLLYAWIPIVLVLSLMQSNLNVMFDVFGKGYVTYMPTILPVNESFEPVFWLSLDFLMSRIFFASIGLLLYVISFQNIVFEFGKQK